MIRVITVVKMLRGSRVSLQQVFLTTVMTRIVVGKSTDHAKPHSICFFYHNIKDNERNLGQEFLPIENTDSDLKVHALHYANAVLVRVRLSFQKFLQTHLACRKQNEKMFGKKVITRTRCR